MDFSPFLEWLSVIPARLQEPELEISGQENCFTLAGVVKQPPYLLFPRGQAE